MKALYYQKLTVPRNKQQRALITLELHKFLFDKDQNHYLLPKKFLQEAQLLLEQRACVHGVVATQHTRKKPVFSWYYSQLLKTVRLNKHHNW